MRRHAAASFVAALALSIAPPEGMGGTTTTITITFDALAADSGQFVRQASFQVGGFTVSVHDSLIIGPGWPDYMGHVGVLPLGPGGSILVDPSSSFTADVIAATFAPYQQPSGYPSTFDWSATTGDGGPRWAYDFHITGTWTQSFCSPRPGTSYQFFSLAPAADNNMQVLGIVINPVPEPASWVLAAIAMGIAAVFRRSYSQGSP